jgi:hypothetical protein
VDSISAIVNLSKKSKLQKIKLEKLFFLILSKDHFDLLDWAILCAQNLDQSESVEDRTKLLIQKMAADFDFIYK